MTISHTVGADVIRRAKIDLAAGLRAAALYGYNEGIDNHFSYAVPGSDDLFLLNPFGPDWSELSASDILTIDADGNVVDGDGEWEVTAFMIHRGAHQAKPSARCVLHTHMPYATAVSMTSGGFDTTISQNSMGFHGRVGRLDYGGLADGQGEGDRIGGAIGDDTVVVMLENHGVLVIGEDMAEAWRNLYFLERACEVQVLAQSTGQELIHVPDHIVAKASGQWIGDRAAAEKLFASVKRKLDRENPGYER